MQQRLDGKVAIVTGGTKGIGGGVTRELGRLGARVFATSRSASSADGVTIVPCDHRDDAQVESALRRILDEAGRVDILVNAVWGGYERMVDNGQFTWGKPFWEQPLWRWDAMLGGAGVRAHYQASQIVAPAMIAVHGGLIVNLSTRAAQKHIANVAYGVSKAATDKMTGDMAHELKPYGITVVSLYPGLVRTEKVMEAAAWLDMSNSESPEFTGRAIAALATDRDLIRHTGQVLIVAQLATDYGFTDIDGKSPRPLTFADV